MRPILFSFPPFELRVALVFTGLSALTAWLYMRSRRERRGLTLEDSWGLTLALVLGVFVGGIGTYAALYGPGPAANAGYLLRGRVPGGSFLGVLWGAAAGAFIFCRLRALPFSPIADDLGAGAALGLVIMRIGCFLNGCCYGRPTTLAWGIVFTDPASRVQRDLLGIPVHPVQLYEAGGAGLIFLLLHLVVLPRTQRGEFRTGTAFLLCAALYSVLRFCEDFVRATDVGRYACAGLSTAQLLSVLILVCAVGVWLRRRAAL